MTWILMGAGFYLLGAVVTYGANLAYWQQEHPMVRSGEDALFSAVMAAIWPASIIGLKSVCHTRHGLQFLPRQPENTITRGDLFHLREQLNQSISILRGDQSEYPDPLPDEPDWSEPDDAERAYARATMPGHASGHTIGWRAWDLRDMVTSNSTTGIAPERASAEELEAFVAELRRRHAEANSGQRWWLESTGSYSRWAPSEPMIGYCRHGGTSRTFYGPGIYAAKAWGDGFGHAIVGRVALWGPMVEHADGYRARYAYPVELWVSEDVHDPEQVAEALSQAYGVPCHTGKAET